MRAAVYHGSRDIRVEEVPDPIVGAGEVVLEVHAAGICGTDAAEYHDGPFQYPIAHPHPVTGHGGPMVPGHEVAGRVIELGNGVEGLEIGEVVASGGGISCGHCHQCQAGKTNLCTTYATVGLQRNGGLAQYCAVPAATCVSVLPFALAEDTAALAQPVSIAVHSMRQGRPEPGQPALVIGAGGIGAFLTYALAELGAEVVVADLQEERLKTAMDLGASATVKPEGPDGLVDATRDLAPVVIYEVTGAPVGIDAALKVVRRGGRVVAVGLHDQLRAIDLRAVTLDELTIVGTMAHVCSTDLPEALRLLASRPVGWADVAPIAIPLDQLVSHGIVPMVERRAEQIKTLVDPWTEAPRAARHA